MGDLDPSVPQVNDPELEANLIRELSIVGRIGKLRVLDVVLPIISLGDVVQPTVEVRSPSFRSTDVFTAFIQTGPASNTILADTGPLPEGIYDVSVMMSGGAQARDRGIRLAHRNAANSANLMEWQHIAFGQDTTSVLPWFSFAYEIALNERLRCTNILGYAAGETAVAAIMARIRT